MRFLTIFLIFLTSNVWAQSGSVSDNIADCGGATAILNPGTFSLQFTGGSGNIKDLEAYPSLQSVQEKNSIWCYFIAPFEGRLSIDAKISEGMVQMVVFQNDETDLCEGLYKGSTEVKRLIQEPNSPKIGLSLVVNENNLYPIDLQKDQQVMFFFNSQEKGKPLLNFVLKFEGTNGAGNEMDAENTIPAKLIDTRKNDKQAALNIMIRDAETGNPVIANLNLSGIKNLTALYSCSDILIPVDKSGKIAIQCEAPGYFFIDREEPVTRGTEHELVLWMQPLGQGKSIRLEEIEFQPGSSELMVSSDAKLRRLKDFLALNSGIKIEIQGHVNSTGENTFASQKLSEARAKRVMNFLIENGINKDRLTSKGYGNTVPVYEKPRFSYEEQANRRVEIVVL